MSSLSHSRTRTSYLWSSYSMGAPQSTFQVVVPVSARKQIERSPTRPANTMEYMRSTCGPIFPSRLPRYSANEALAQPLGSPERRNAATTQATSAWYSGCRVTGAMQPLSSGQDGGETSPPPRSQGRVLDGASPHGRCRPLKEGLDGSRYWLTIVDDYTS